MSIKLYISLRELFNNDNEEEITVKLYKDFYYGPSDLTPITIENDNLDRMLTALNDDHYVEFDLSKLNKNDIFEGVLEKDIEEHCLNTMRNQRHFKIQDKYLHIDIDEVERKLRDKNQFLVLNQAELHYHYADKGRNQNYCKPEFIIYDKLTGDLIALEFKRAENDKWLSKGEKQIRDYLRFVDQAYIVLPYSPKIKFREIAKCYEYGCGLLFYPSKYNHLNFLSIFDEIFESPKNRKVESKLKNSFLKMNFNLQEHIIKGKTDYEDIRELVSKDRFPLVDSAVQLIRKEINHRLEIDFKRIDYMIDKDYKEMLDKNWEQQKIIESSSILRIERFIKKIFKYFFY